MHTKCGQRVQAFKCSWEKKTSLRWPSELTIRNGWAIINNKLYINTLKNVHVVKEKARLYIFVILAIILQWDDCYSRIKNGTRRINESECRRIEWLGGTAYIGLHVKGPLDDAALGKHISIMHHRYSQSSMLLKHTTNSPILDWCCMLQQHATRHFKVSHLRALVEGWYCYNDWLDPEKLSRFWLENGFIIRNSFPYTIRTYI